MCTGPITTCKLCKSFGRIRNKGTSLSVIQVDDLGKMKGDGREREREREIVRIRSSLEAKEMQEKKKLNLCKWNFMNVFM